MLLYSRDENERGLMRVGNEDALHDISIVGFRDKLLWILSFEPTIEEDDWSIVMEA